MTVEQKFAASVYVNNIVQFVLRLCGFAALWQIENKVLWIVVALTIGGDVIDMAMRVAQRYRDPAKVPADTRQADFDQAMDEVRQWRTLGARLRSDRWWAYLFPVLVYCGAVGQLAEVGLTPVSLGTTFAVTAAVMVLDEFYIRWGTELAEAVDIARRIARDQATLPGADTP